MVRRKSQAKLKQLEKFGFDGWSNLCQELGLNSQQTAKVYEIIVSKYNAKNRYWHVIEHPLDMLRVLEKVKKHVTNLPAIKLAIWLHDLEESEIESVKTMRKLLDGYDLPAEVAAASVLILDTIHPSLALNSDGKIISDIDLFVGLAGSFGAFQTASELIRLESGLTDQQFYSDRLKFFRELLAKPIFQHDCFQQFESKARANIERSMVLLNNKLAK